jgi:hypothetical protein
VSGFWLRFVASSIKTHNHKISHNPTEQPTTITQNLQQPPQKIPHQPTATTTQNPRAINPKPKNGFWPWKFSLEKTKRERELEVESEVDHGG